MLKPKAIIESNRRSVLIPGEEQDGFFDAATLNLDFRGGVLDSRIDFQRTTTGTYYRGPFNQNLALHSEAFNNWVTNDASVLTDQTAAPNGTVTADKIVDNTVLAGHTATRTVSFVSGQQYTFSVYAKRGELDFIFLRFYATTPWATNKIGIFDLLNGTAQSSLGSPAVSITDAGNGWYRCSITATADGTTGTGTYGVLLSKNGTASSYTGTGTEGIFVWGAQVTEGSLLTPYLPTTTAAITQGQIAAAEPWNLFVRSEEFNTTWAGVVTGSASNPVVTANAAVAPNGTTTADQIDFNCGGLTLGDRSIIRQTLTGFTSGSTVTLSVWLKSATGNTQYVQFHENGGTGPITYAIGPDWQRISYSYVITAGTTGLELRGNNSQAVTTSSVYAWGAQVNQGSAPLEYRSTTTAALWLPRFENDPVTGDARGLLIEGGATNLQLYSADITNGSARTNITIGATKITAPDGTTSGELVSATTTGATSLRGSTHTIAGTNATGSIFIKQASLAVVQFWIIDSTTSTTILSGTYTFATKATAIASGTGTMTATDAGNGWVRIALSVTTFVSGNNLRFFYGFNGNTATAGDSFYLWGVQIEQQPFASSYIPTTTATVARGADSVVMTGTNFSSWFNASEGTFIAQFQTKHEGNTSSATYLLALDSSASKRVIYLNTSLDTASTFDGTLVLSAVGDVTGVLAKVASAYNSSERAIVANGGAVATGSVAVGYSSATSLGIGLLAANSTFKQIIFFPTRLPNATLQSLTI